MLKRQRPATPPPSSLDDPPAFLPGCLPRLSYPVESRPRSKRQRIQPPPLDGALRGWQAPRAAGIYVESDDEEDWIEDVCDTTGHLLPPSATADQYKNTNSLLHELHVLNQHRLLFVHVSSDRRPSSTPHAHIQDPVAEERPASWTDGRIRYAEEKGLVEEIQRVQQRYEDANRLLGSLFLSRRREMEGMPPPGPP